MFIAERDYNARLPLLVSFELDEFANIGKIPDFTEILDLINIEETLEAQSRIKSRCTVSLGKDESVTIGIRRILGIYVKYPVVQVADNIRTGKGSAGMSALGVIYALDNPSSHSCRE